MNKMPSEEMENLNDELLPEHKFDYAQAKPNRFAAESGGLSAKGCGFNGLAPETDGTQCGQKCRGAVGSKSARTTE